MSAYPVQLIVTFDFSSGATFGYPFTLNDPTNGVLGTSTLGNGASTIVDISAQVSQINTRGGYDLLQDQFQAGSAVVRVIDTDGRWNPQNVTSPYYGLLTPLRKIRIAAKYLGTLYYLGSFYTQAYNYTYPTNQTLGYVDIACSDAFRLFNLAIISTVTGAVSGESTGTRVGRILDQVGFPTSMRSIDTGDSLVQADPATTRTSLGALKNVEFSEQGAFYINSLGNAVFRSRSWIIKQSGANPTIFDQSGNISYKNITFAFDDKLIINQATIQTVTGAAQTFSDSQSIATYFPHSITQQNLVAYDDATAMNIAREYVTTRKATTIRIDSITLDLTTPNYDLGIKAALGLDYFNTAQISNIQPGGSVLTKTLQIMGIQHDITPKSWLTTFTTSEPINDGFILNSTLYGVLDTSTLAY